VTELQLNTPVVLTIFNRPDNTKKVFESIRQVKPKKLFIIADAPSEGRTDDVQNCAATHAIVEQVDWNCEVIKNYSPINLGAKKRIYL
jgi:hypothetical protein